MTRKFVAVTILALVAAPAIASGRFTAGLFPEAGIKKGSRIVIKNDSKSITAFKFDGNIRKALVSLRSTPVTRYTAFGSALFNSNAVVRTPAPAHIQPLIQEAALIYGVDPRLIVAVARRESRFNQNAVSSVGARGVMQLMPATAQYLGVADIADARQNINGGTKYLRMLLNTFHGDLDLTLAAYNAGPGAVQKYRGIPPYRETRAYVTAIRAEYELALRAN